MTSKGEDTTQVHVGLTKNCETFSQMRCTQNDTRLEYLGDDLGQNVHPSTLLGSNIDSSLHKTNSALGTYKCHCLGTLFSQPWWIMLLLHNIYVFVQESR